MSLDRHDAGASRRLRLPAAAAEIRSLRAGDSVLLDGEVVLCAGMTTHQRVRQATERGEPLPIDLRGAALLHLGSYSEVAGERLRLRYLNPTTSTRFDEHLPSIIEGQGLRLVGGKGGVGPRSVQAMRAAGCVYVSFLGGGCTPLTRAVRHVLAVEWNDLVPHYRLLKLRVEGLGPATVGIDAHGTSVYDDLAAAARRRLPQILADLALDRARAAAPSDAPPSHSGAPSDRPGTGSWPRS